MEKFSNEICFEYSETDDDESDYRNNNNFIVADYAVNHSEWTHDDINASETALLTITHPSRQPKQKGWTGYAALAPSEVIPTPLFEQNPVIETARRCRNSKVKESARKL